MCDCSNHTGSASQTLDELDFERGLWFAAQYGDLKRTNFLLDKGFCVDQRDSSGYTSLHYAARNGHLNICQLLVSKGACVNAVTTQGQATALHRAAANGKLDVVQFLLEKNGNYKLKDADGKNALHRAVANNHLAISQYLLTIDDDLRKDTDNRGKKPGDYANSPGLISLLT